jgi:hypothetical protein
LPSKGEFERWPSEGEFEWDVLRAVESGGGMDTLLSLVGDHPFRKGLRGHPLQKHLGKNNTAVRGRGGG